MARNLGADCRTQLDTYLNPRSGHQCQTGRLPQLAQTERPMQDSCNPLLSIQNGVLTITRVAYDQNCEIGTYSWQYKCLDVSISNSSTNQLHLFQMAFSLSYIILALSIARANAAIGPVTDLHIVNGIVSPDGFNRT